MKDRKRIYGKSNIEGITRDVKNFFEHNQNRFKEEKKQMIKDLRMKRTPAEELSVLADEKTCASSTAL